MADVELEFNNVTSLRAEALGEPGQRTFRVLVDSGADSAVIWLEKEQLFQLGLAMMQLLATIPETEVPESERGQAEGTGSPTRLDFKVGKLVLGHDGANGMFVIDAHDIEGVEDSPATVRVLGDRSQVGAFAEEALQVCAAGRPICHLCGGPIDTAGHTCPRSNGHAPLDLSDL